MTAGTYCYVGVCRRGRLGGARGFGAHRGRRGAGHIVALARLQLVVVNIVDVELYVCLNGVHDIVYRATKTMTSSRDQTRNQSK